MTDLEKLELTKFIKQEEADDDLLACTPPLCEESEANLANQWRNWTTKYKNIIQTEMAPNETEQLTSKYDDLSFISPTSCLVERLFSRAKLSLGQLRGTMTPLHLECVLYLLANSDLWNVELIATLVLAYRSNSKNTALIIVDEDKPQKKPRVEITNDVEIYASDSEEELEEESSADHKLSSNANEEEYEANEVCEL